MANSHNLRPPWPKGVSGNPAGRQAIERPLRVLSKKNYAEFVDVSLRLFAMPLSELKRIAASPEGAVLEVSIAKILLKGIQTGDPRGLDFLLNRLHGKPKISVEVDDEGPRLDHNSLVGILMSIEAKD